MEGSEPSAKPSAKPSERRQALSYSEDRKDWVYNAGLKGREEVVPWEAISVVSEKSSSELGLRLTTPTSVRPHTTSHLFSTSMSCIFMHLHACWCMFHAGMSFIYDHFCLFW